MFGGRFLTSFAPILALQKCCKIRNVVCSIFWREFLARARKDDSQEDRVDHICYIGTLYIYFKYFLYNVFQIF